MNNKHPYRYIFLDLDDTIWDFHANARLSLKKMYEQQTLNRYFENFDEFFRIYAMRNMELWEMYGKGEITKDFLMIERFRYPLAKMGLDDLQLAEAIGKQYLEILPEQTTLLPFARELLDYLHSKYPLTLISNGFVEVQYKKLKSCQIEHYFSHVVLSEQAGALKPDPEIFNYALHLNQASPEEAIMIGDSFSADIVGAKNAGIDQIYLQKNNMLPYTEQQATFIIKSLEEIFSIL
jgi:YjjG family noncanonical pyrimidine nucleotidase